jgi:transcriptional antiterminator NusG
LRIRKGGQWQDSLAPLFPGYVFLRAERVDETSWHSLRTLPGFIRFLPASGRILPLDDHDQATLLHFLSFGEVVEKSVVTFDEAGRIRVVSGLLMRMEGLIIKVDRRKGRTRVRLELISEVIAHHLSIAPDS